MQTKPATTVYGSAFGDAWGWLTEFSDYPRILTTPAEDLEFPNVARITDDTQMSLYLFQALKELTLAQESFEHLSEDEHRRNHIRRKIAESFLIWLRDPDNDRAPGETCLRALNAYQDLLNVGLPEDILDGDEGCHRQKKGSGANMRSAWIGLLDISDDAILNLAIIQSEVTHGHPLALSSAALTALLVKHIRLQQLPLGHGRALQYLENLITKLIDDASANANAPGSWNADYLAGLGALREVVQAAEKTRQLPSSAYLLEDLQRDSVCSMYGRAWIAEEALVGSLAVADAYHDRGVEGLRRLVYTSGDSDTLGTIGGAFLGAAGNFHNKHDWARNLEPRYQAELADTVLFISRYVAPETAHPTSS